MRSPEAESSDDEPLYPTGGALAYRLSSPARAEPCAPVFPMAPVDDYFSRAVDDIPRAKESGTYDKTIRASPRGTSFEKAMARAFRFLDAGRSVHVILAPGIYRSRVAAGPSSSTARLLVEARQAGTAVIRGSDVWGDWQVDGRVWRSYWPHRWGMGNAPDSYGDPNLETADLMRRREMVFVNGRLHRQVLNRADLEAGTFFIDEAGQQVLLFPLENVRPSDALVEIGVRSGLIELAGRRNLTFRGLRFEHDASFYFTPQRGALQLANCRDVLVEDCAFAWNNTKGLQIGGTESGRINLRRVSSNHNGCLGILVSRVTDLVLEDCETSFNNWRGSWAGKYRGSPCGIKIMRSRGATLLRHRAIRNLATGIWIDEENRHVRIQESTIYGNYRGLHLEAGGGPIVVERNAICSNRQEPLATDFRWVFGSGIVLTHVPDVALRDNFLADNDQAQIGVRDDREQRILADEITGEKRAWRTERLVMEGNTVVAGGMRNHLVRFPGAKFDGGVFLASLRAARNAYVGNPGRHGFVVGGDNEAVGFANWRELTGQDSGSTYGHP